MKIILFVLYFIFSVQLTVVIPGVFVEFSFAPMTLIGSSL